MGGLARLLDDLTMDPFWNTPSLFKRLDAPAAPAAAMAATTALGSLKVDVRETAAAYEIMADMPGVAKEDVKLSFAADTGALTIEAERRERREETLPAPAPAADGAAVDGPVEGVAAEEQQEQPLVKYHFKETTYGKAVRSFKLPQDADASNVEASLSEGVLRITIPKREAPAERTIEIK